MLAIPDWMNVTKGIGLAAYCAALTACLFAARRASLRAQSPMVRCWAVLAAVQFLLVVDIAFSARHRITEILGESAHLHNWYNQRHLPQVIALMLGAAAGGLVTIWILWRLRRLGWPAVCAAGGSFLAIALFLVSCISLHAIDAVLYRPVGPTMVVAFAWIAAASLAVLGAAGSARRM